MDNNALVTAFSRMTTIAPAVEESIAGETSNPRGADLIKTKRKVNNTETSKEENQAMIKYQL